MAVDKNLHLARRLLLNRKINRKEISVMKRLLKFLKDESGVTAVEYALIAALIAVAIIIATTFLGQQIAATFNTVANAIPGT
jgi:pilus assembly protein Flp/PilA